MQPLTVVSYNIRTSQAFDDHPWTIRREPMATLIRELAPTVLGTQEGFPDTVADLLGLLPRNYAVLAEGRRGRQSDESSAILYDSARLSVLDVSHRWFSDTPELPGSATWGNELPRMATIARFHDAVQDTVFSVINVHLDHVSEESRVRSAHWLAERIAATTEPVILLGDFNVGDTGPVHQILINAGLRNAVNEVGQGVPAAGTFGDYQRPAPGSDRIDWILVGPGVGVVDAEIVDRTVGDRYPSDHVPVRAALTLPSPAR